MRGLQGNTLRTDMGHESIERAEDEIFKRQNIRAKC